MATLRELEAQLIAIRADAHAYAAQVRADQDLTPEGQAARLAGWGQQRGWSDALAKVEAAMYNALDDAPAKAAELRADMTALPTDTASRTAAELRHQRRSMVVEAAIKKGGGTVAELIANALPEDVPLIVETVSDHASIAESDTVRGGLTEGLEMGLGQRSPVYSNARQTAAMTATARHIVDAQLDAAREAISNPNAQVPGEHSYAAMSVDVAGTDVGDLAA